MSKKNEMKLFVFIKIVLKIQFYSKKLYLQFKYKNSFQNSDQEVAPDAYYFLELICIYIKLRFKALFVMVLLKMGLSTGQYKMLTL